MANTELVALLADGEYHSGQQLAAVLGARPAEIAKLVGDLWRMGLEIEAVRGKGYRINGGLELLDAARIKSGLAPLNRSLLTELVLHSVVDSTNAEALRRLQQGAGCGLVCLAEQQTAGRGRRGRTWVSPFASNIYLSLAWEFKGSAAVQGLSLAVGVAVARALQGSGVPAIKLKWPNDVLCGGAKLGGVLIEIAASASAGCRIVIGVGLNVSMPRQVGAKIDQRWTDVRTATGVTPQRNQLLIALLDQMLPLLDAYESEGFSNWREQWLRLDAYSGQQVIVISGDQHIAGTASGIDDSGALLLETVAGTKAFHGGEVSVRAVK